MSVTSVYQPGDDEASPPGIACGTLIYAPGATILIQSGNRSNGDLTQEVTPSPQYHQSIDAALRQQGSAIIDWILKVLKVLKIFFF